MNKQKVYILTFHRAVNYGAILQCFALTQALRNEGYKVEVIDYFPDFLQKYRKKVPKKPLNALLRFLIIPKLNKYLINNLPLTKKYFTKEDLTNSLPKADIYICGSDQIWNKSIVDVDLSTYLFDFVPNDSKKISYAASIGGNEISNNDKQLFTSFLSRFDNISVREKIAQIEIEKLIKLTPQIVLDPTLIVDSEFFQKQISDRFKDKNYILVVDLEKNLLLRECAIMISKKENLPILNVSGVYYGYAKNPLAISPNDWLSAIFYAKYICVNSFHGLCLSLIFEKQFYYIHKDIRDGNNRPLDLLKKLNLINRYVKSVSDINTDSIVEYSDVNNLLTSYRNDSISFLRKALKR